MSRQLMMHAGSVIRRLNLSLTSIVIWLFCWNYGGADPFGSVPRYQGQSIASTPAAAGVVADSPAITFGPQYASRQLAEPLPPEWDVPPYSDAPYGIQPLTPQPYLPPSRERAYEYDSFMGSLFGHQESSNPPAFCWLTLPAELQLTWIQGQGNALGFTEFDRHILVTDPLLQPFRIIPGFATRYVSGPTSTDLPGQLFDVSLELAATYQLQDAWTLDVGIQPGLYGDFRYVNNDTFRLGGHAVASRPISPTTQGVLGFVYLSREDIAALPVVGFVWQPSADIKWELVFPRPKLAMRVGNGSSDNGWMYLRGELGGNSWSIERANHHRDVATYRDLRLILGYETLVTLGIAAQLEAGWVFSRKLMYASGDPDFTPRDTFLIRAGLSF